MTTRDGRVQGEDRPSPPQLPERPSNVMAMGQAGVIEVADNAALQEAVADCVRGSQASDPLAPVTLVVDTSAQAWSLRRQVVQATTPGSGVANVRAMTMAELVALLAERAGVATPAAADPLLQTALVEALLRSDPGPLSASADHPETARRLSSVADDLAWCRLGPEVHSLADAKVSLTSREAIQFVTTTRQAFGATLGTVAWPDAMTLLSSALEEGRLDTSDLGHLIIVAARVPAPLQDLLRNLARTTTVTRVAVTTDTEPIDARVMDFPDPATETDFAVRLAAEAMEQGASPGRVALLYSTDVPYARLLEQALDDARISWHGPTGQTLRTSTVARCLLAVTALAVQRGEGGSGITRPLLMRLLGLGHLSHGSSPINPWPSRALVRREGLFGDARQWRAHLDALALAAERVATEPGEGTSSRRRGLAEHALPLAAFIGSLDTALESIVSAPTWADLGQALWTTHEDLHLKGSWWTRRPEDAATVEAVRTLLLEGFPAIDALGTSAPAVSVSAAADMLERSMDSRRARHGTSSVGVHVGPVASSRGLVFDHVILLGACEGLLPSVRGDDPLLPDAARRHLRQTPDDLPTSAESEDLTGRDVRAVSRSAQSCIALLSRGALPGRAVGIPSRYLPGGSPKRIASPRASLVADPAPLSVGDLAERSALAVDQPPAELARHVRSLAAWASPEPGPYFGALGPGSGGWELHDQDLSASAIEQFLHCPYHFFVQRILGFSTDEFEDHIDTIAPNDLGSLLHQAFETFVDRSRADGTLPEPGQPWPNSALEDLRRILDDEVAAATGKGLTGWGPAWDHHYDGIVDTLPAFLAQDAELRRDPPTAPVAAEQNFGADGDPVVEFPVSDTVTVRLRGSIDRVDVSADGHAVGVVDYKTGSSTGFDGKLGQPTERGKPRERQKVQDLVYDAAARVLYPEATRVDVHFMFVPNNGQGPTVVSPHHDDDRAAVLQDILSRLDDAGHTGNFLPTPRTFEDYCPVCRRLGRRARIVARQDPDEEPTT